MKLFRGKYKSRKSMKKAGEGRTASYGRRYLAPVQSDMMGNRFIKVGLKKYRLSRLV